MKIKCTELYIEQKKKKREKKKPKNKNRKKQKNKLKKKENYNKYLVICLKQKWSYELSLPFMWPI